MLISVNVIHTKKMIIDFPTYLVSFRTLKDFVINIQIRARNN
jgi:hypothetical protein